MDKRSLLIHLVTLTVSKLLPGVIFLAAIYEFHQALLLLARGEGNPYIELLASVNRARSFAFLLGILGVVYGIRQRELRRQAVHRFDQKLDELNANSLRAD